MIIFAASEFIFPQVSATNYSTTVVAGTQTASNSGDGGPATSAEVNSVASCWVDSNGTLFFVDDQANLVRMVDRSGIISTLLGTDSYVSSSGAEGTSTSLVYPWGIAGDSNFIYVSDAFHIWRYIRATGQAVVYAGTTTTGYSGDGGPATSAHLSSPLGMWLTTDGTLYFADQGNQVVRSISSSGIINLVAGTPLSFGYSGDGGPATNSKLAKPNGVYVDTNGIIYMADTNNNAIRYVNNGIINTYLVNAGTSSGVRNPYDVKGDSTGNLYIAEHSDIRVVTTKNNAIYDYISGENNLFDLWIDNETSKVYFGSNSRVYCAPMFVGPTEALIQQTDYHQDHPSGAPSSTIIAFAFSSSSSALSSGAIAGIIIGAVIVGIIVIFSFYRPIIAGRSRKKSSPS